MTPTASIELSAEARRKLARLSEPLGLAIAGALLVVLDLRFALILGGRSSAMDLLPDALGYAVLAAGLGQLAFGGRLEGTAELVVTAVASLFAGLAVFSVASWFVPALEHLDPRGVLILDAAAAAGLVAICWIFHELCRHLGLRRESRSWLVAALLCAVIWPLPVAIPLYLPGLRSSAPFGVMAGLVQLAPVVALFVAAFQLRSAARRALPRNLHRGGAR